MSLDRELVDVLTVYPNSFINLMSIFIIQYLLFKIKYLVFHICLRAG